jgi:hypothetical protein
MMMVNFNKKNEEEVEVVKKDVIKLKESCNNNTHAATYVTATNP